MNHDALLDQWRQEEIEPFAGWDFSHLDRRMIDDIPTWDYMARAADLLKTATSVVDLDTGGGERLLDLRSHWPRRVIATEAWPPNAQLSQEQLSPFGVQVIRADSNEVDALPFAAGTFDLVLNRHGAFHSGELARILVPDGIFLTKQVHGMWAHDLLSIFGATPPWPDATPERYVPLLEAAGLTIVTLEDFHGRLRFSDVGAIVYYLKAIPWLVPGFSVETHQVALFQLQARLDAGEELAFAMGTYLIEARKGD